MPAVDQAADRKTRGSACSAAAPAANKKPVNQRHGFKTGEWIVYPAHGVGRIVTIEEQEIAGISLELFVITFDKDKMTLRVPTGKSSSVGMRKLAEENTVKRAMDTLKGRARVKRTMWSRRAQEYEAKINSGDLIAIAEVVRDLYRSESQPEQSYSERQLYEAALDRMAREIAAVEKLDERGGDPADHRGALQERQGPPSRRRGGRDQGSLTSQTICFEQTARPFKAGRFCFCCDGALAVKSSQHETAPNRARWQTPRGQRAW